MESLLKTLWCRLRFYLIDWGLIARRGIFYIGGSDTLPPPLEREKEAELIARMDEGDESVRGTLIEHNLRLVAYIARRFENTGINIEDLISIGTIGLIKAVNTYRSDKNIKLATYASRCIENEILMHLRKTAPQKSEVSFDEPLNTDWDGNELLLSDILGTDEDLVLKPIDCARPDAVCQNCGECGTSQREKHGASAQYVLLRIERAANLLLSQGSRSTGHPRVG